MIIVGKTIHDDFPSPRCGLEENPWAPDNLSWGFAGVKYKLASGHRLCEHCFPPDDVPEADATLGRNDSRWGDEEAKRRAKAKIAERRALA